MTVRDVLQPGRVLSKGKELSAEAVSVILKAIDVAIEHGWDDAVERAAKAPGRSTDAKVRALSRSFARELGSVGAATGAAAAVPAVGTAAALSLGLAEFGWFTVRASELILSIAALHGHDHATVDERRAWILAVLIFGSGAAEGFDRLFGETARVVARRGGVRAPIAMIRGVNSSMARMLLTRYGRKRGAVAIGTALPFGIGAFVGGTANHAGMKAIGKHADSFLARLPVSREAVSTTQYSPTARITSSPTTSALGQAGPGRPP
ncbi:MAG: EcsC family protein [Ilumatobacteraceae bacterium]